VNTQDDDRDNRVDDLLPGVEHNSAVFLPAVPVRNLTPVEELLARVHKVVEDGVGDGRQDDYDPDGCGEDLHETTTPEDRPNETKKRDDGDKRVDTRSYTDSDLETLTRCAKVYIIDRLALQNCD